MRKTRRTATIFGVALLCAGLVIQIAVFLILFVPPEIPAEFSQLNDGSKDNLEPSPPILVAQDQPALAGLSPVLPGSNTTGENDEEGQSRTPRSLPAEISQDTKLATENLPGHKQNELIVAAIGQVGSETEENIITQPKRISIPALGVDAPIRAVGLSSYGDDEGQYLHWAVPNEYAVGWHQTSAPLRTPGNTVLNGHNNIHGAVFQNLVDLELGERLILYDDNRSYEYQVTQRVLFEEDGQSLKERHWNARWMLPTSDERLTIITCWPNSTNSHRLVVVAQPIDEVGT